ncbi:uncharacterized protein LOC117807193 [Notolabrus celidotus]|uniref:uncharacterized protein LOC117807193 n=1 Tax=Notolabrus celidotus TaxID=1203425 RepID=UPI0014900018|nr:uncharacterized protein LOC117807193 [Notolabrus celidotus]
MKFLLSSLLLASFCALSSWSVSSGTPVVTQTPDVYVMEGGDVNISCCWEGDFDRVTINWQKKQTEVKRQVFNSENGTKETQQKVPSGCSHLTFPNITKANSGRYTCKLTVEIPAYAQFNGSGTVITVTDEENTTVYSTTDRPGSATDSFPTTPVIISLAVLALVLLISLLCICTLKRKQARAARVIYEVPHTDSEMAEMDKHSTSSSRGSSQWCQVPVYESFDYFERMQNKESG